MAPGAGFILIRLNLFRGNCQLWCTAAIPPTSLSNRLFHTQYSNRNECKCILLFLHNFFWKQISLSNVEIRLHWCPKNLFWANDRAALDLIFLIIKYIQCVFLLLPLKKVISVKSHPKRSKCQKFLTDWHYLELFGQNQLKNIWDCGL